MFMFVMINFSNKHTKLNSLNLELTVLYFNKLLKINPNKLETPDAGHHSGKLKSRLATVGFSVC